MILVSLTEGVGLLLLVPLLELLGGADSRNALIQWLLRGVALVGLSPSIGGLLLAFLVLVAVRSLIQYARERLGVSLQHQLVDRLRLRAYAALLGVEWRWIAASRGADQANLLLTDINRIGVGLQFGIGLLATAVTLLAYLLAAVALSWAMTSLALVSGGLVFWLLTGQRHRALGLGRTLGAANQALQRTVQESLAGIKLTKILGREGRHLEQFRKTLERLREQQVRFAADASRSRALFQVGGAGLLAGYLYVGLTLWHTPVPELLTLVLIFSRLIPLFVSAQQQFDHWLHALPALDETTRLLAECRASAEPVGELQPAACSVREAIRLEQVTLAYAERARPALDGLTLSFPARTSTAIMGASGAGKSTLADVLMGLLTPDSGRLTVDGEPITGARRRAWRQSVAYVPQEVFLFHDSIRNNLLWGRPTASLADLRLCLERAAAGFVFSLPQGLETRVGDGGIRLSGGERQRLALARALLTQPALLILDEATSALDRENEARVRDAIEHLHGDLTLVIIGHRLATLEHADQVVVLEAGRIAAQGTWSQVRSTLGDASNGSAPVGSGRSVAL